MNEKNSKLKANIRSSVEINGTILLYNNKASILRITNSRKE